MSTEEQKAPRSHPITEINVLEGYYSVVALMFRERETSDHKNFLKTFVGTIAGWKEGHHTEPAAYEGLVTLARRRVIWKIRALNEANKRHAPLIGATSILWWTLQSKKMMSASLTEQHVWLVTNGVVVLDDFQKTYCS